MQLPDDYEMTAVSTRTVETDWIVGIAMMVISLSCCMAYYLILSAIYKDKEMFRMASYRFMFFLGIFDVCQTVPHFVTGIFTVNQSVFHPGLAKAMGVIATPCYVTFTILTIFLSFNRFAQLTSPVLEQFFFGGKRWMIWIGIAFSIWLMFASALASPWATIRYIPDWYSWDYDTDLAHSYIVKKIEMVIEIGGIFISAFFYLLIILRLLKTKKQYSLSKGHDAEIKVLIQATVITVYCTVLNVLWHNYTLILPTNLWTFTAINFMWICNSSVHPIIYFIINQALRNKIGVKKPSRTLIGPVSKFDPKVKAERTQTSHTVTSVK